MALTDTNSQQLEVLRQVKMAARAAQACQKAARSNHIQRLAEREAAQKSADVSYAELKKHGAHADLEAALYDAEFALKMANARAEVTGIVATKADISQQAADAAVVAACSNMNEAKSQWYQPSSAPSSPQDVAASPSRHAPNEKVGHDGERAHATDDEDARNAMNGDRGLDQNSRQAGEPFRQTEQTRSVRGEEEEETKHEEEDNSRAREVPEQRHSHEQCHDERERRYHPQPASTVLHALRPQFAHILWKKDVERAFSDYSAIRIFPEPPRTGKCSKLDCLTGQGHRQLKVCPCDIEAAFTLLQIPLKAAHFAWHPDRWSKCPAEYRESFQVRLSDDHSGVAY